MAKVRKPLLWYYKPGNNGPTIFSDTEDLIESQPVSKELHDWQQSTKEAQEMIKVLTVEGNILPDPFMGSGTTGLASLQLNRRPLA